MDSVRIELLLQEVINQHASDLHIQVGLPPMLRVDGALAPIANTPTLTSERTGKLIFSRLDSGQQHILLKDKEFDFSFSFGNLGRFRVNAFHERGNLAAAFRLIPNEMPTIEELGLPSIVSSFADYPRGLVLVTGPTGSGKSTTLAALIDKINTEKAEHIITIEDPIEFTHKSKRSVVVQREVHYDTYSFNAALRSALREDPDIVLIGEMRDAETITTALAAAETGHLVFTTLHSANVVEAIDRLVQYFPATRHQEIRNELANSFLAIAAQKLLPSRNGGRVAAFEVLLSTDSTKNVIRSSQGFRIQDYMHRDEGMQTMAESIRGLRNKHLIDG